MISRLCRVSTQIVGRTTREAEEKHRFLQSLIHPDVGLEKRGDNNLRKRIYMSAVTSDLYRPMYGDKVVAFSTSCSIDASPISRLCDIILTTISTSPGICISG